ncbi:MAG: tetratricopeptide repeat protein [Gaiellaceae bacterium]
MSLFVGGLLVAIGFGAFVLALLAALLIVIAVVAFVAFWPDMRRHLGVWVRRLRGRSRAFFAALLPLWRQTLLYAERGIRGARRSSVVASASVGRRAADIARIAAALMPLSRQTLLHAERGIRRGARRSSVVASASAGRRASALGRTAAASFSSATRALIDTAHSTTTRIASRLPPSDPRGTALRLNAAGTQYRRDGRYDEAVECHRRALEILRALDDRQAAALTQSNLALALSHAGDDGWAIGLFEEAASTLHDLGDEEHEAQIMANLGLAHRRHGRREEGDNVLELALSKLTPASSAYQAIEAELRRAS